MAGELSYKLWMKIHYDMNNVTWSVYEILKFNPKARFLCMKGESWSLWYTSAKFEYYDDEWVNILLCSRDNLLNFGD